MADITEYRCLLISPSDVAQEREALVEVVSGWNAQIGRALGARIELVRWEAHSAPDLHGSPQEVLNRQITPSCHFGVALFWSRLGTPTAQYRSGSDEEIRGLLDQGLRVLVYFNRSPIPQMNLETEQYKLLRNFRQELEALGLVGYYNDISHLREQLLLHLTQVVSSLLDSSAAKARSILTAPLPDVRVFTNAEFVGLANGLDRILAILIENHSPVPVFVAKIFIEMENGDLVGPRVDSVTGEPNTKRKLEAGDSLRFHLRSTDLPAEGDPSLMRRAAVEDAVGRIYYSDREIFRAHISYITKEQSWVKWGPPNPRPSSGRLTPPLRAKHVGRFDESLYRA